MIEEYEAAKYAAFIYFENTLYELRKQASYENSPHLHYDVYQVLLL
jgi:hypothetical protein